LQKVTEGLEVNDSLLRLVESHRDQLVAYESFCRQLGAKPVEVALAWLVANPAVATAVIGAATPDEILSSLGAMSAQLDADALTRLDEIWPGPGEAPQAYAW
jgi:aryl-alcohol dehydrogenase-like predicted oxidoreductase